MDALRTFYCNMESRGLCTRLACSRWWLILPHIATRWIVAWFDYLSPWHLSSQLNQEARSILYQRKSIPQLPCFFPQISTMWSRSYIPHYQKHHSQNMHLKLFSNKVVEKMYMLRNLMNIEHDVDYFYFY